MNGLKLLIVEVKCSGKLIFLYKKKEFLCIRHHKSANSSFKHFYKYSKNKSNRNGIHC